MRLRPALFALMVPVAVAAQSDEWVRDDMSDDSLWLLKTSNLTSEKPDSSLLPGSIGGAGQWVMSQGDGPAYVVYFIPGRIEEVEIDTHRLTGAAGDFSLAASTDGKLYQPIDTGSVTLDSAFGWDYRLMSAENIPTDATHLLVRFPDGSSAHRLSEVWIKYQWDDALAARFLPAPAVDAPPNSDATDFGSQSDAELEAMLRQLQNVAPAKDPNAVRADLSGNGNAFAATNASLQPANHTEAPVAVSVNLPNPPAQTVGADNTTSFKFDDANVSSNTPQEDSTSENGENEKKAGSESETDTPRIELHLDSASHEKDGEDTKEKSGSANETADEKPEVAWVLPTFTLPVVSAGGGENPIPRPTESPTGNLQIKIDMSDSGNASPETTATKGTGHAAAPISVSSLALVSNAATPAANPDPGKNSEASSDTPPVEVRVELPSTTVPGDAPAMNPVVAEPSADAAATVVVEPAASASGEAGVKEVSEPDDSRPTMTFVRRGPRSKSHAFFSSRR